MLFPVQQVNTNLSYLNSVLKHFLCKAVRSNRYLKDKFFPADFIPIHNDSRNAVETNFRAAFTEIKKLNHRQKVLLLKAYRNQQKIQGLCSDKSIAMDEFSGLPDGLIKAIRALGSYLYSSTLNLAPLVSLPQVNDTLAKHFQRFVTVNGKVCCFCGINDYEEQLAVADSTKQWRAAYDHYLPKKLYPLAAVNFNNLIPICFQCNSKAKLALDPCLCKSKIRRLAFYPYVNNGNGRVKFSPNLTNIGAIVNGEFWSVSLDTSGLNNDTKEKQSSWNRVFKITSRVEKRLNDEYKNWIKPELDKGYQNTATLKRGFQTLAVTHVQTKHQIRGSFYKGLLFANLAQMTDDVIDAICESIAPISTPATHQDAIDELNDLGFNF